MLTVPTLTGGLLALALATAGAPSAGAASIGYDTAADTYFYVDETNAEGNQVAVRMVGAKLVISDVVAQRTTTGRCVVAGPTVECGAGTARVAILLGGGNDRVEYRAPQAARIETGSGGDSIHAGGRDPSLPRQLVTIDGGDGFDWIEWARADRAVSVTADDDVLDGVAGENLLVRNLEGYQGSRFADRLFGSPRADVFIGNGGDDVLAGGEGGDLFVTTERDGADDHHGGPGVDGIHYGTRSGTTGVTVTLDNVADDGLPFERDQVRSNVENVTGTSFDDRLFSFGAFSTLDGGAGNDRLDGDAGPDQLIGGPGRDTLLGGSGADSISAGDSEADTIDCGPDRDVASRDRLETKVAGCESDLVGRLRLAQRALSATAGEPARIELAWRHPKRWKLLRTVTVHVSDGPARLGSLVVDPHSGRVRAEGAVRLAHRARLARDGGEISVALPVRFDAALQGRRLTLAVEAVEVGGRRQLIERAGTVQVR